MIHLILRLLYLLLLIALPIQLKGRVRLVLPLQVLIVIAKIQEILDGLLVKQGLKKDQVHLQVVVHHLQVHHLQCLGVVLLIITYLLVLY